MKIGIISASGKAGSCLLEEALNRNIHTTAIVRSANKISDKRTAVLEKDLFQLTYDDIKDFDVIINAFGTWEDLSLHSKATKHLCSILNGRQNIRLLIVGGAGSLFVNKEHSLRLMDTPEFPPEYLQVAQGMSDALDLLRKETLVNWTYISPAAMFIPDGPRTGHYQLGGEELMTDESGQSQISYGDYAISVIDEAQHGSHIRERISVIQG